MSTVSRREFLINGSAATIGGAVLSGNGARAKDAPLGLQIALFTTEVTAPIGHPLMGGGIASAKEVVDPLEVHGIIMTGSERPIVIVAVDWCEIRNDAYDRWRSAIAEAVGTTRERVMLTSLHQHDAPISDLHAQRLLDDAKATGKIVDADFHEKTVRRVASAANRAVKTAVPLTHIGIGQATVEKVASNRRWVDADGKVHFGRGSATRDPKIRATDGGLIDPILRTLSFWNGDQAVVSLSAYSVHPMSYYGGGGISADFVGIGRRRHQADDPKVRRIYVSGCGGNTTAGKFNDGAAENRAVLAERMAEAMRSAWKSVKRMPVEKVEFRTAALSLEPRDTGSFHPDAMKKRLTTDTRPFGQCLAALGLSWQNRVRTGQTIDVPCLDFGTAAYLVLPAESYVEYQLFAQSIRPGDFIVTAGYGECGPGYIPTEKHWQENDSNLGDWCWVKPGSEERMQQAIRSALKAGAKKP